MELTVEALAESLYKKYYDSNKYAGKTLEADTPIVVGMIYEWYFNNKETFLRKEVKIVYVSTDGNNVCAEYLEPAKSAGQLFTWSINGRNTTPREGNSPSTVIYHPHDEITPSWDTLEDSEKHYWLEDAREILGE